MDDFAHYSYGSAGIVGKKLHENRPPFTSNNEGSIALTTQEEVKWQGVFFSQPSAWISTFEAFFDFMRTANCSPMSVVPAFLLPWFPRYFPSWMSKLSVLSPPRAGGSNRHSWVETVFFHHATPPLQPWSKKAISDARPTGREPFPT